MQGRLRATGLASQQKSSRKPEHLSSINQCSWHGQTRQTLLGFVCLALGRCLEKAQMRACPSYIPATFPWLVSLGTLLSYFLCFSHHVTRVPLISQSTSFAMCQRGVAVQTCGWPGEGYPGLGGADPCTPSLFPECILSLFPSYCPSTTPGFTEIFKLHL